MIRKRINPELLGFDFDGVIADVAEAFIRLAHEDHGYEGIQKSDITNFDVDQCLDIPLKTVDEIFHKVLVDSVGTGLIPMPGAVEVLTRLTAKATVTVITARPIEQPIHDWLKVFFPKSALPRINIVAMGAHDDKARHIKEHGLQYFIDDRAETCVQLKGKGVQPIVYCQPWNANRHQLPVVNSWQEIETICL